jgi:hypothetical protein
MWNDEFEKIWKEKVMGRSEYYAGIREETLRKSTNLLRTACVPAEFRTKNLPHAHLVSGHTTKRHVITTLFVKKLPWDCGVAWSACCIMATAQCISNRKGEEGKALTSGRKWSISRCANAFSRRD